MSMQSINGIWTEAELETAWYLPENMRSYVTTNRFKTQWTTQQSIDVPMTVGEILDELDKVIAYDEHNEESATINKHERMWTVLEFIIVHKLRGMKVPEHWIDSAVDTGTTRGWVEAIRRVYESYIAVPEEDRAHGSILAGTL